MEETHINEAMDSLKETYRYCATQKNTLKQKKCNDDDLRLLMNEIFCTDADLYMAILSILKQGMNIIKGRLFIVFWWLGFRSSQLDTGPVLM